MLNHTGITDMNLGVWNQSPFRHGLEGDLLPHDSFIIIYFRPFQLQKNSLKNQWFYDIFMSIDSLSTKLLSTG